jgi:hypothetical protein
LTSRERWTIYPLLFLALGAALRDKLTATVDSRFMSCEELEIVDRHGQLQMRLTSLEGDSGKILLYGPDGRLALAAEAEKSLEPNAHGGSLKVLDGGSPRVVVSSGPAGGTVTTIDNEKNLTVTLGHEVEQSGVMAVNRKHHASFSARFEPRVATKAPEQPGAQAKPEPKKPGDNAAQPAAGEGDPPKAETVIPTPGWSSGRQIP